MPRRRTEVASRARKASATTDIATLRKLALSFPGVEEGTSYGTMAWRVRKSFIARVKEDGESIAIRMEFGEREILMEGEPETFFITDHYRNYPMVLIRLNKVHPDELKRIFGNAWRKHAGPRLIEQLERRGDFVRSIDQRD
jgi:hypothetical protein